VDFYIDEVCVFACDYVVDLFLSCAWNLIWC
jgi:hypothetical protein